MLDSFPIDFVATPLDVTHEQKRKSFLPIQVHSDSLSNRKHGGLGVKRVEDSLYDNDVRPAVDQALGLVLVRHHQLVERYVSERRVFHILRG